MGGSNGMMMRDLDDIKQEAMAILNEVRRGVQRSTIKTHSIRCTAAMLLMPHNSDAPHACR